MHDTTTTLHVIRCGNMLSLAMPCRAILYANSTMIISFMAALNSMLRSTDYFKVNHGFALVPRMELFSISDELSGALNVIRYVCICACKCV